MTPTLALCPCSLRSQGEEAQSLLQPQEQALSGFPKPLGRPQDQPAIVRHHTLSPYQPGGGEDDTQPRLLRPEPRPLALSASLH
eukprot:scaffold106172_cov54-Phaeocystis_antarctica.AAC.3